MYKFSKEVNTVFEFATSDYTLKSNNWSILDNAFLVLIKDPDIVNMLMSMGVDSDSVYKHYTTNVCKDVKDDNEGAKEFVIFVNIMASRSTGLNNEVIDHYELLYGMYMYIKGVFDTLTHFNVDRVSLVECVMAVQKPENTEDANHKSGDCSSGTCSSDSQNKDNLLVNMNNKAKNGSYDKLIGRDDEINRLVHTLSRRKKSNPIIVGDSGVGKTSIVEGLALKIVNGDVPEQMKDSVIYSLSVGELTSGTKYRGEFEKKVVDIINRLKNDKNAILFIDEIHMIVGAGKASDSDNSLANIIKPQLASGEIRCIGSTTLTEYRTKFESDKALSRRFQRIDVDEPSSDDTVKIIKGVIGKYEEFHGVKYTTKVIKHAVNLSTRYMSDKKLPDKAIDIIDEAGATVKLNNRTKTKEVTTKVIDSVVSRMAKVPVESNNDDSVVIGTLEPTLKSSIFGQDKAVEAVVTAVKLSKTGLNNASKPIASLLFTGPTGVGKTELAKKLAEAMSIPLIRFDMSEYTEEHSVSKFVGSPPGYVGYESRGQLTEAISKNPHCVLLLDEIEKANRVIFNMLLQVMDCGRMTDNRGETADFKNVILIMTSNVGARDAERRTVGFASQHNSGSDDKAYQNMFAPEFRNRLDANIKFNYLSESIMDSIVNKYIAEINKSMVNKKISVKLTDNAAKYLANKGYDKLMGARPLARLIQSELKVKLVDFVLNKYKGCVVADVDDDCITVTTE